MREKLEHNGPRALPAIQTLFAIWQAGERYTARAQEVQLAGWLLSNIVGSCRIKQATALALLSDCCGSLHQ